MKILGIAGSKVGSKTAIAMQYVQKEVEKQQPESDFELIDLADYDIIFSDGRNYFEYEGDTKFVATKLMEADVIILGTPTFQASIPATLKNLFDLLPVNAFLDKTISIVVTAGSSKHYMMAEQQLKPILAYMKANIVPNYVFIEEKDFLRQEIINDDIHFRIQRIVEDTFDLSEALQFVRDKKNDSYDF